VCCSCCCCCLHCCDLIVCIPRCLLLVPVIPFFVPGWSLHPSFLSSLLLSLLSLLSPLPWYWSSSVSLSLCLLFPGSGILLSSGCCPGCPHCPHCPGAGPPQCHCPHAYCPLVLASSHLPVIVLMVHCGCCCGFAFLVVVGAVLIIPVVSAVTAHVGIVILVILVLSTIGVGVFVIGVAWPCSLCSIAMVVLSGLCHWWCISLCHPAVVAVVLPVLRGGGVVSGRWQH